MRHPVPPERSGAAEPGKRPAAVFHHAPVLDALPDAVVVVDRADRIVYANDAAAALLRRPRGELTGASVAQTFSACSHATLPTGFLYAALGGRSEAGDPPVRLTIRRDDLVTAEVDAVLRAVPGVPGHVVAVVRPVEPGGPPGNADSTFLSDASTLLAGSLDYDATLATVAELVVPVLADWCAIDVEEEDGSIRRLVVTHADPAKQDAARALRRLAPDAGGSHPVVRTLTSGKSQLFSQLPDRELECHARDAEQLRLWRDLGLTSAMVVPLTARGRTFGAISLDAAESRRHYGQADLQLAEDLARRAALAVDNARLHRERSYQTALLQAQAEASMDGMLVVSPAGDIVSYNRRFVEMWPIPEDVVASGSDEAALRSVLDKVVDPHAFLQRVQDIYAGSCGPSRDEILLRDGRVFDRYGAPLRADDGASYGWAWYLRDVTEQRRAHQEIAAAGERFERLVHTLQQSLLPPHLPTIPGMQTAARYLAAGEGMEVGGDFYDLFRTAGAGWGVVMGDVCGKGAEAATVTALARYTLRAAAMQKRSPRAVLGLLNDALLTQRGGEPFLTAVYARLRQRAGTAQIAVSCGGHPLPLLLRREGTVEELGRPGTLLGVLDEVELHDDSTELRAGDAVVFCTDGVLDARRADGQILGETGLRELLAGCVGLSAEEIAARIERTVVAFQDGALRDDTAVLVLRAESGRAA